MVLQLRVVSVVIVLYYTDCAIDLYVSKATVGEKKGTLSDHHAQIV